MANVQYSDPFGSYVKGAQAGAGTAIRTGEAARHFRDSDKEAAFRKWYEPLRQQEAQTHLGGAQLDLNTGLQKNAAHLTAYGAPGNNYLSDTLNHMYPGYGFGNVTASSQLDVQRAAREGAGEGPSPYDPLMTAGKEKTVTDPEFEHIMQMKWGPNWRAMQGGAAPGQPGTPAFDPFEAATGHIFGQPAAEVPGAAGGVQAPGAVDSPAQPQPQAGPYNAAPYNPPQYKANPDDFENGGIFVGGG